MIRWLSGRWPRKKYRGAQSEEKWQSDQANSGSKRQPNDPVYVDLAPAELDEPMQKAERTKGAVADQIRSEFVADPMIKLIERDQERSGLLKPHLSGGVDVEVSPKVSLKEAYGIDRKTGKPVRMLAVVFEATITSQTPPATYTVSESGHAQRNLEVSKRFAKQVKQVILEKSVRIFPRTEHCLLPCHVTQNTPVCFLVCVSPSRECNNIGHRGGLMQWPSSNHLTLASR